MKRLTKKIGDKVILPSIPMIIKSTEDMNKFHEVRRNIEENIIRLSEYEDSNLSPNVVKSLKEDIFILEQMLNKAKQLIKDYDECYCCVHSDDVEMSEHCKNCKDSNKWIFNDSILI